MTTTDERALVDADILVYAATPAVPQYEASRALLESDAKLCVSPQVFAEFYSVKAIVGQLGKLRGGC